MAPKFISSLWWAMVIKMIKINQNVSLFPKLFLAPNLKSSKISIRKRLGREMAEVEGGMEKLIIKNPSTIILVFLLNSLFTKIKVKVLQFSALYN